MITTLASDMVCYQARTVVELSIIVKISNAVY